MVISLTAFLVMCKLSSRRRGKGRKKTTTVLKNMKRGKTCGMALADQRERGPSALREGKLPFPLHKNVTSSAECAGVAKGETNVFKQLSTCSLTSPFAS